jgi:hypothetical protein
VALTLKIWSEDFWLLRTRVRTTPRA